MKELWERDLYINDNIIYLFNTDIYEYDMKEAGFSLIKAYQLLDDKTISELTKLSKKNRHIKIGKLENTYNGLKDNLKTAFKDARELFIKTNKMDDNDIISIKKDAFFVKKRCSVNKFFNDLVDFRLKNKYTSYIRLPKLEIYYNPERIDIKGISDETLPMHVDGMLEFIRKVFLRAETSDIKDVILYIVGFVDKYKRKELPLDYYREFNSRSLFSRTDTDDYYENYIYDLEDLDISYNFHNIIIPILMIFMRW